MAKTYSGSIALTKLKSVEMEMNGQSGKVRGIFIPYDANYIEQKDGAAYLSVSVRVHDSPDKFDQEGFIAHKASTKHYKAEEDKTVFDKLPILGNFRSFSNTKNDTAGVVDDEVYTPDSDLPF